VIETHVQADHASGGLALARRTGAAYCLHEAADVAFDFTPLAAGQELVCGNVTTRVLRTPGHTPESLSLVVTDRARGPEASGGRTCRARPSRAPGSSTGASSGCSPCPTTPRSIPPTSRGRRAAGT